jgi:hypothetical protein
VARCDSRGIWDEPRRPSPPVAPSRSSAVREIKSLRSGAEGERSNQQEMAAIGYREGGKSIPRQSGRSKWKVEVEGRSGRSSCPKKGGRRRGKTLAGRIMRRGFLVGGYWLWVIGSVELWELTFWSDLFCLVMSCLLCLLDQCNLDSTLPNTCIGTDRTALA